MSEARKHMDCMVTHGCLVGPVEDCPVLSSSTKEESTPGDQYKVQPGRPGPATEREPPKGEHDWTVIVCYRLSKSEAAGSYEGMNTVLDFEHLDSMSPPVCLRCEQAYQDTAAEECKGEPVGRLPDGRPLYKDGTFPDPDEWMPQ